MPGYQSGPIPYNLEGMRSGFSVDDFIASWERSERRPSAARSVPAQATAFAALRDAGRCLVQHFASYHNANEHRTKQSLIRPHLDLLGWTRSTSRFTSYL